jgi:hypothetical protein
MVGYHFLLDVELTTDQTDDRREICLMLSCPTLAAKTEDDRKLAKYLMHLSWNDKIGKYGDKKADVVLMGKHMFSLIDTKAGYIQPQVWLEETKTNPEKMRHLCRGRVDLSIFPVTEMFKKLGHWWQNDPSYEYVKTICKHCKSMI